MAKRQPSQYDELKEIWYKKLEESGFDDIEADEFRLKEWSSRYTLQKSADEWKETEAYYEAATNFLNSHKFDSDLERIVWEYHTNALSVRDIAKILNETKIVRTNRTTVWLMVKRLKEKMQK